MLYIFQFIYFILYLVDIFKDMKVYMFIDFLFAFTMAHVAQADPDFTI